MSLQPIYFGFFMHILLEYTSTQTLSVAETPALYISLWFIIVHLSTKVVVIKLDVEIRAGLLEYKCL
jgi:hypothetical protein